MTMRTTITARKAWILANTQPFEFFLRDDIDVIFAQDKELRMQASTSFVNRASQIMCNRMDLCWGEHAAEFILSRPTESWLIGHEHGGSFRCFGTEGIRRPHERSLHDKCSTKYACPLDFVMSNQRVLAPSQILVEAIYKKGLLKELGYKESEMPKKTEGFLRAKAFSMKKEWNTSFFIEFGVALEQEWPWSKLESRKR